MERNGKGDGVTIRKREQKREENVPCQIPLREIQHRRHEHLHHRFSPFSMRLGKVVGPFCMVLILYCAKCEG